MILSELVPTPGRRHYQVIDRESAYFVTYAPEYGDSIYCWVCRSYVCAHAYLVRDTGPAVPDQEASHD